ncbi:ATP-dependent helicase [Mesorhizobium sp. CA18]|uniref:ATP-dependent helicase n=1 Tax=unclassified Mesorhizobium TaxID=325217 RepID=UPI001CCA04E9|nr:MULTISPECIES: ATP-dependent helicase [unclassified Mesorhizobium]MBZ9737168.1 ATP-dependent helicase [Mesorhizobium sp. CA9]MBZ9826560.1 ATP-dependent helicase [Mesorhizobium sp. CA18]MBZ9830787.1 ATP-dependent helicase [Mesorhizobium sp. CA2]MBZ9835537.1 ATP-dependent helicase [Mesorhizobium sp. CA3]MBZ9875779.1 ATP-dependent helicase [Mesorhizobium sp. Ca11]
MFDRKLYLRAAEQLRDNKGQWDAYNSKGNCVVLAGPGSGKTKTLTIKLARMLAEDVEEPRGLACITYNNECARELETRLDALGVQQDRRVFIGTVHSFSLTQIVLPYAKTANLGLPDSFAVANQQQQEQVLGKAFSKVYGGGNPASLKFDMNTYRRSILNREAKEWYGINERLAKLSEAYEAGLRERGLIDFEDMPLLAVRALRDNEWIQRALLAKFPILAVDEYQDLGRALHRMVLGLCFSTGMRLFAVGDVDQSIYGFNGAYPELLEQLSERADVETIPLQLNYRCGSKIVAASELALGAGRGYQAPDGAPEGQVYFHPLQGAQSTRANYLFDSTFPEIQARSPGLRLGDIAILYPTAKIGNAVADAARARGLGVIRTDTNAVYPRSSRVIRWLEQCALWCAGGWQRGAPRFSRLSAEGLRLFGEAISGSDREAEFQQRLVSMLWSRRDPEMKLHEWLTGCQEELLGDLFGKCRMLRDEQAIVESFLARISDGGDTSEMTLGLFAGVGEGASRLVLSTLHSAKGREFSIVVLFGMDAGEMPRFNQTKKQLLEARRLFYVGLTRAKSEVHMVYSAAAPSSFVREVQDRL